MKVDRQSTNSRGRWTGSMWRAPGTMTARQSGNAFGQPPGHLGRGPGVAFAGDRERRNGDPIQLGSDLGVRGGEDAVAMQEAVPVVGQQRGFRAAHLFRVDVGAVIPPAQRRRGARGEIALGGAQTVQDSRALLGGAPAYRADRGERRHQCGAVPGEVLGDQGAERETDQMRAGRDVGGDSVGQVGKRDACGCRWTRTVAGQVERHHVDIAGE